MLLNPRTYTDHTAIQTIQKIEREGQGNTDAQEAWKMLVDAGPDAVMPILEQREGSNAPSKRHGLTRC